MCPEQLRTFRVRSRQTPRIGAVFRPPCKELATSRWYWPCHVCGERRWVRHGHRRIAGGVMTVGEPMKRVQVQSPGNPFEHLNCGSLVFSGSSDALYERHLTFNRVAPIDSATPRDRFEAVAHAVRDLLSQRWIRTEQTYQTRNVKRVYYVSLEFLMGRSLANNITNLLLDPIWQEFCHAHSLDPLEIIAQEPDAGLGNGGLGRLAACFLDSMATLG